MRLLHIVFKLLIEPISIVVGVINVNVEPKPFILSRILNQLVIFLRMSTFAILTWLSLYLHFVGHVKRSTPVDIRVTNWGKSWRL